MRIRQVLKLQNMEDTVKFTSGENVGYLRVVERGPRLHLASCKTLQFSELIGTVKYNHIMLQTVTRSSELVESSKETWVLVDLLSACLLTQEPN